jgi:hypothetical protein
LIKFALVADLDSTTFEQLQFAVKSPESDGQLRDDCGSAARAAGEEANQTMKPSSSL